MRLITLAAASATAALLSSAAIAQDNLDGTVPVTIEGTLVEIPLPLAAEACAMDEDTVRQMVVAANGGGYTQESTVDLADPSTADASTLNEPAANAEQDMAEDVAATTETTGTDEGSNLSDPSTADTATLNEPAADAQIDEATDTAPAEGTAMAEAAPAEPVAPICDLTQNRANELGITAAAN